MNKSIILIVVTAIFLGGIIYYTNYKTSFNRGVMCTTEALLCPDGSSVGREGSECRFRSCPSAGSISGKLEQVQGNFRLLVASPISSAQEVSYSIPLKIKISNSIAQLIGKNVVAYGMFSEGNTFEANRLEESSQSDSTLGEVRVGQTIFVNGVSITLNRIVEDSRCPVDVWCIQAGWVKANVFLKSDTDKETIDMQTGKSATSFDSFAVSLVDVKPNKIAAHQIKQEEYILTFKVNSL